MSLKVTRAIIDAIHSGELAAGEFDVLPVFNLEVRQAGAGAGWVGGWLGGCWPAAGGCRARAI